MTAWSPDKTRLATVSADGSLRIWNLATHQFILVIDARDPIYSMAWSLDTTKLALLTKDPDNTVHIWDIIEKPKISYLKGHDDLIYSIVWLEDGTQLVTAAHDKTVKIWNVAEEECIRTLTGPSRPAFSVNWS